MNKIKFIIVTILIAFVSITAMPTANAVVTSKETKLTPPVGSDILPGGDVLSAETIEESFIFSNLIPFVITYAIRLAIGLSVIALIIGGYQYMTAYGDEEKHKNAQKTIQYALIGLVLAITAYGIVKIITTLQIT
jgi:hypothetical protein